MERRSDGLSVGTQYVIAEAAIQANRKKLSDMRRMRRD